MSEISRIEVQRKLIIEFQKEEVTTPDTPRYSRENSRVQYFLSNSKNDETPVAEHLGKNWRSKNRLKNKLRMNMC